MKVAQVLTVLIGLVAGSRAQNGTCAFAGHTSCCTDGNCLGGPIEDCFCDDLCRSFGDCCEDINVTCPRDLSTGNDTYLLFANNFFVRRVDPDGSNLVTIVQDFSGRAFGIDYHHRLGMMFWSDIVAEEIYQANLDGSGMTEFVNTSLEWVEDVAVDWINDKLYWTDIVHARIEVADIFDSNMRKVLLRTGANTLPRAIVVDPRNRYMYWSDWGETAMIERASMDGQARTVIISNNLIWPNGITIDYAEDKLYWADAFLDKIEYSNLDGTNRSLLETQQNGVFHPFSITIENELLYWTEWQSASIFATHKLNGQDILVINPSDLFFLPNGIEAVTPNRQPQVDNSCDGHGCSNFCLLSSESAVGYTCACPSGGFLDDDLLTCNFTGATPEPPEGSPGSCVGAGYDSCCTTGFCAGSPPSCLCDFNCHIRGDCCDDIADTCPIDISGSCVAAGFTECCPGGIVNCAGDPAACFCDINCLFFQDCCHDFFDICAVLGAVQNIAVMAPSVDVLTITWDPPTNAFFFSIVGYQVRVETISTVVYDELVNGSTTQVPNLVRFTPYYISIVVVTAFGNSEEAMTTGFTEEGTPTIAPSGVALYRTSGATIVITWSPLTLEQAQGFIIGYDISYQPTNSKKRQVLSVRVSGNSNEFTIMGLDPALSYTASVSAATAVGVGPASPPVTPTVLGVVQNIAVMAPSVDVLTITWDPPTNAMFFSIVGYQVRVETISTVVYDELVNGLTTQVPNLVRFTPYYISIAVVTTFRNSEKAMSTVFTEEGIPTIAPSGVALDRVSGTTMTITWSPLTLEQAQGFIIGYDISYQPTNSRKRQVLSVRAPGNGNEFTIMGLDPALSYTASVSAATAVGVGPASPLVTPTAICFFQIHFFGADSCDDLNSDPAANDIIQAVVDRTNPLCQCELVNEQIINFLLACNADPNTLTFRARVLGNENANCDDIVDRVEEWVTTTDTELTVQGTELTTNTECPVRISNFDDSFCNVTTGSVTARAARIAAPTVVIVVVVGVAIVIVVAVLLHMHKRRKTTHEVLEEESEAGSINQSEAGASFKTEKDGIIAVEVGKDREKAIENEYQPVGGMNFHNPIYNK